MKKRILMVVPSFKEKGPVIVAENIIKYSEGIEFEYLFLALNSGEEKYINKLNNEKFNLSQVHIKRFNIKEYIRLINIIKEFNPDIIHVHTVLPTFIGWLLKNKYTVISTLHNNPFEDYELEFGRIKGKLLAKLMIYLQGKLKLNIAISNYVKSIYKDANKFNIETVYNGIEEENNLKSDSPHKSKYLNFITVSVLNDRKNVIEAIKCIEELNKNNIEAKLTLIGSGPNENVLKEYVKNKGLVKNIIFKGNLERKYVFDELDKADIFIFTSLSEGLGLVIIEAMMKGLPIICNDIPVVHEIIEENGVIIKNYKEIISAYYKVSKNYGDYTKNSYKIYKKKFTVNLMSKEYERIYKKLIKVNEV